MAGKPDAVSAAMGALFDEGWTQGPGGRGDEPAPKSFGRRAGGTRSYQHMARAAAGNRAVVVKLVRGGGYLSFWLCGFSGGASVDRVLLFRGWETIRFHHEGAWTVVKLIFLFAVLRAMLAGSFFVHDQSLIRGCAAAQNGISLIFEYCMSCKRYPDTPLAFGRQLARENTRRKETGNVHST